MNHDTKSVPTTSSRHREAEETPKNQTEDQKQKIKSSTHLCITIRWGVEAAAPASPTPGSISTAQCGDAPC
jgi:hypothetical protein